MRGAILPLPQYVFMAWCLVKHRDIFAFYVYLHYILLLTTCDMVRAGIEIESADIALQ
jgi:hypothetical protein